MTLTAERIDPPVEDPVSNVLKWVLLVVAIRHLRAAGLGDDGDLPLGAAAARPLRRAPMARCS